MSSLSSSRVPSRALSFPTLSHWPRASSAPFGARALPASVSPVAPAAPVAARTLYTVQQFAECEPAFTLSALRNLIFKAQPRLSSQGVVPGNGLLEAGAIVRVQRKVLIHRERFLAWVQQ